MNDSESGFPHHARFSDSEVKRILRRAIELHELREATWAEDDLIQIATELGIDPAVVRAAIEESESVVVAPRHSRAARRIEGAVLAFFGAATFIPIAIWDGTALPSIVTVGATSVMLALDSDEPSAVARYLSRNVWLWGGFWLGGSTQFHMAPDATLLLVMGAPVFGGLVGLTLMKLLRRGLRGDLTPPAVSLVSRVVSRLKQLVATPSEIDDRVERVAADIALRLASV